ncbi:hypothetical protein TNCV_3280521 [Trichonephila clavipes]|nr:hypothetical protein TNCV_3280521 [Trichonephila clavipes]
MWCSLRKIARLIACNSQCPSKLYPTNNGCGRKLQALDPPIDIGMQERRETGESSNDEFRKQGLLETQAGLLEICGGTQ